MKILLAPMEGLLDTTLRDVLTRVGGVDRCVSEFIRVTNTVLPERAFTRVVPELMNGGRTPAGVPVRPQLLGSDPICMADNAARLAAISPFGVDLNFGCPAKAVNQSRGGAVLLDEPELLARIVGEVRKAVPPGTVVSAKMRLGYHDDGVAEACAQAMMGAGADELVIHARTKAHGYKPPAYWHRIAEVLDVLPAHRRGDVIANGEIWTPDDARQCQRESGCENIMIGRGMVTYPGLGWAIRGEADHAPWSSLVPLFSVFWEQVSGRVERRHRAGRIKQWLNYLRRHYVEGERAFEHIRVGNDPEAIEAWLRHEALLVEGVPAVSGLTPLEEPNPRVPADLAQAW